MNNIWWLLGISYFLGSLVFYKITFNIRRNKEFDSLNYIANGCVFTNGVNSVKVRFQN
jgi:hypothetical protein